jgi:hypothetical protein
MEMFKFIIAILIFSSCCSTSKTIADENADWINRKFLAAEVYYPEGMAGCSYLIKMDEKYYQPLNLPDSMQVTGKKVWIKFHNAKEQLSSCMMGDIIEIENIYNRK